MKIVNTVILFVWALIIILFTLQPGSESAELSGNISAFLYRFVDLIPRLSDVITKDVFHSLLRTGAHFFNYFILGFLALNALRFYQPFNTQTLSITFALGSLFGLIDETIQRLVPGRAFTWFDVLTDSLGFLAGMMIYLLILKIRSKSSKI